MRSVPVGWSARGHRDFGAERAAGLGDALVVGGDEHAREALRRARAFPDALHHRHARDRRQRLAREARGREARRDDATAAIPGARPAAPAAAPSRWPRSYPMATVPAVSAANSPRAACAPRPRGLVEQGRRRQDHRRDQSRDLSARAARGAAGPARRRSTIRASIERMFGFDGEPLGDGNLKHGWAERSFERWSSWGSTASTTCRRRRTPIAAQGARRGPGHAAPDPRAHRVAGRRDHRHQERSRGADANALRRGRPRDRPRRRLGLARGGRRRCSRSSSARAPGSARRACC